MVFVLLAIIIAGLALYETGYGVTNTWLKSFRKQIVVQSVAAATFFSSAHFFLPPSYTTSATSLFVSLGFLSMLAYTSTATIKNCGLMAIASAIVGGILFPILLHFSGPAGYFSTIRYVDTVGAGTIHFVGGVVALIASVYTSKVMGKAHSIVIRPYSATLGFLTLWAGWVAYVGIISLPVLQGDVTLWLKGLINLSTATSWGAVCAVAYMWLMCGRVKMRTCTVGGLAGMVAASADPLNMPFWVAAVVGGLGGILATLVYSKLNKHEIVDPSNAISIHLAPGLVGVLVVPLFETTSFITSQVSGISLLAVLATSMGVIICEIHNLVKPAR